MNARRFLPLFALALIAGCHKSPPAPIAADTGPARSVHLVTVRLESSPTFTEITGTLRPRQRAVLAAKWMGAIEELPVTLGQSVKAGDVLVRIAAGEINARVVQARSQLNLARRDLERERDLLGKGASTADMVRGLEDRFAMTEAMVREAEAMLGYAAVRAPFDGVVARKWVNTGDLAAPGQPLLEIEGTRDFEVECGLPDSLASGLAPGSELRVAVPASELEFTGKLTELSSAADPAARTVLAKIAVPPQTTVRSGQFARVSVPSGSAKRLRVPESAVTAVGQLERVFVADAEGRAALRLVKTGARTAGEVEILSGLDDGERVVVAPPADLREGQPLEVKS